MSLGIEVMAMICSFPSSSETVDGELAFAHGGLPATEPSFGHEFPVEDLNQSQLRIHVHIDGFPVEQLL